MLSTTVCVLILALEFSAINNYDDSRSGLKMLTILPAGVFQVVVIPCLAWELNSWGVDLDFDLDFDSRTNIYIVSTYTTV